MEGKQSGEYDDLEAFAVRYVKSASVDGCNTEREREGRYIPIQIVVQDLDTRRLEFAGRFFGYCDEDRRVRFADHVALFSTPFEFVATGSCQ